MKGYDPEKCIGTVKERCLETKKDRYGLKQCVLNKDHAGTHLHRSWSDPKILKKENERVESELKKAMAKAR